MRSTTETVLSAPHAHPQSQLFSDLELKTDVARSSGVSAIENARMHGERAMRKKSKILLMFVLAMGAGAERERESGARLDDGGPELYHKHVLSSAGACRVPACSRAAIANFCLPPPSLPALARCMGFSYSLVSVLQPSTLVFRHR